MRDAMDAMPVKVLCRGELVNAAGECCALGCVGQSRGVDMSGLDPEEAREVGKVFGIAQSLAREIVYENDEGGARSESDADRFVRIRKWLDQNIIASA